MQGEKSAEVLRGPLLRRGSLTLVRDDRGGMFGMTGGYVPDDRGGMFGMTGEEHSG